MIKQTEKGVLIEVKVRPNSAKFMLKRKGDGLVLEVTSPPQEGKANMEIVKGLKRLFGRDVAIIRGLKEKRKLLLIKGATKEEICYLL